MSTFPGITTSGIVAILGGTTIELDYGLVILPKLTVTVTVAVGIEL